MGLPRGLRAPSGAIASQSSRTLWTSSGPETASGGVAYHRGPMATLAGDELRAAVAQLDGWALEESGNGITRQFRFADFSTAFAFMTAVALKAEAMDHHPE